MPAKIQYFDMNPTISPPNGHNEPFPFTLGPNWQTNDIRFLFVSGSGVTTASNSLDMPMRPDPPTGYTGAYVLDSQNQTHGVYYRRLLNGDVDTSVKWPKPPQWRYFMWLTMTARGVDPATAPVAGKLKFTYRVKDGYATVNSVSVPAAGEMVYFVGTFADPGGGWPAWASSLGVPTGWSPMVATDRSGATYYPYDQSPAVMVAGKIYATSGTTGTVQIPIYSGGPAFFGMYCFLRQAPDVSVAIGAA